MARGRKKTPAAIAAAKGNPSRRPVVPDPAASATSASKPGAVQRIAPPSFLEGDALKVWHLTAPVLQGLKLLTDADVNEFGRYCEQFARWIRAARQVKEEGETYTVESNHGKYIRDHPAVRRMNQLEIILLRIEDRFGMNPAERQRIFAARAAGAPTGAADGLPLEGGRTNSALDQIGNNEDQPEGRPPGGSVGLLN
jgi:P27 family predicted phage terminase small subunit